MKARLALSDLGPHWLQKNNYSREQQNVAGLKAAVYYLKNSKYRRLYAALHRNRAARSALQHHISKMIKKEVGSMSGGPLSKALSLDTIVNWSWGDILKDMKQQCPLLFHAIAGAMSKSKDKESPSTEMNMGFALANIAHQRKPRQFKLLQGINSILMWKCNASQGLMRSFNQLGLTSSASTARSNVDRIVAEFDTKIKTWKLEIEKQYYKTTYRPACRNLFPAGNCKGQLGYTICWDNVQLQTEARHQGPDKANSMWMWAMCYAAKNRIEYPAPAKCTEETRKCVHIPVDCILPTVDDYMCVKERMIQQTIHILVTTMGHFAAYYQECEEERVQSHTKNSNLKSELVNLGVVQENPSSTSGVINILQHLQQYVPMVNNKYIPVVCHGDGLSVERHQDAQRARAASQTEEGRLKGLVPTPQEFHKRCIILQDTMTTLMEASGTSRGSALNIKAIFNHRNVARDVAKCFNHAVDFLEFMTHGYVTLMAMHLTGLDDMDQVPEQSPYRESLETRTSYLYTLARSIVDTTFPESKTGAELEDDQEFGDGYPFCTCKTATDEQMVRCSNTFCTNGTWFHLSCKSIALLPDGDWYCSEDCAESNLSIFCTCKRTITGATMIKCSNGSCKTGWFHVNCKNVAAADIDGEWYCSLGCRTTRPPVEQHEERDHKWEYTKSVIHRGLYDLSHRAMIRENDGKGLMTMWKLDMLEFYRRKHPKYLILGHILLTDISGFQTMRVAHDMVWNRTVNITGGKHRNIPMDLANEFLNREFKEKLKHAHGRYTTQDVRRKSVMVGPLENVICEKFHATTHTKTATSTNVKKVNVAKFVKEYHHDKLCQHIPNRPGHKHMELYINQQEIDNPTKLFQKLKKYAQKRDMRKEIMNR